MGLEVSFTNEQFPKDYEFDVGGLLIPNMGSVKLDDDAELNFVSRHRQAVKDWAGDSEQVKVTGSPKYGPAEVAKMFPEPEEEVFVTIDENVVAMTNAPEEEGGDN
jgi:hypothetical protein